MDFFQKPPFALRARALSRIRPRVEELESRITPYALSGDAWPHPQLITISFVPDGTLLAAGSGGYYYSNMFANFYARFHSISRWQNEILKGVQLWAQQANINFTIVADNGATEGAGPDQQGDPNMGDIRIGGFNFGSSTLAMAIMPPPINNYSAAGDIFLNTGQALNIGTQGYDLATVTAHEIGHALGLYHSNTTWAEMFGMFTGIKQTLSTDDIQGIQAIYGARQPDAYDAAGSNGSFATASNITSTIDPNQLTADVNNLDLTTTSDQDYYTFTAPANTSGTMTVNVQSQGLSLLAPTLTVYDANQTQLGFTSATKFGVTSYGATLTLTLSNVTPGAQYYVKVAGVDTTALSTGAYALTLNFGTGPNPVVPLPVTTTPNGNPVSAGGGEGEVPGPMTDGPGADTFDAGPAAAPPVTVAAVPTQAQAAQAVVQAQAVHTVAPVSLPSMAVPVANTVVTPPVIVSAAATPHAPVAAAVAPVVAPVPLAAARPVAPIPDGGGTADVSAATPVLVQDAPAVESVQPASSVEQGGADQPATPAATPAMSPDDAFWAAPAAGQEESAPWLSLEPSAPALDSAAAAGLAAVFLWGGQPREVEEAQRRAAGGAS